MDPYTAHSRLADGPFKLIETPIHAQKLTVSSVQRQAYLDGSNVYRGLATSMSKAQA